MEVLTSNHIYVLSLCVCPIKMIKLRNFFISLIVTSTHFTDLCYLYLFKIISTIHGAEVLRRENKTQICCRIQQIYERSRPCRPIYVIVFLSLQYSIFSSTKWMKKAVLLFITHFQCRKNNNKTTCKKFLLSVGIALIEGRNSRFRHRRGRTFDHDGKNKTSTEIRPTRKTIARFQKT